MKRLAILSILVVLAGCQAEDPTTKPVAQAELSVSTQQNPSRAEPSKAENHAACGQPQAACGQAAHEGCEGASGPVSDTSVRTITDSSGATVTAVGEKLSGVPVVSVVDLLARSAEFEGKIVRIEGNVSAMCHHRRAWFAVQQESDRAGQYVRVMTAPSFLVPGGSIGKKARTEGKVELIEVNAKAAAHYSKDHQLGSDPKGPVKAVVIRATGAEFL